MTFARVSTLVVIALGASVVSAVVAITPKGVMYKTGQQTAYAACCALFPVVERIQKDLFDGAQYGEDAHSALRLSFHDAIDFLIHSGKGGGADGSILAFNKTENAFPKSLTKVINLSLLRNHMLINYFSVYLPAANEGIDDITDAQWPLFLQSGLSAGDFVHLAAAVGTVNCPDAPRLQFFMGRPAPKGPVPRSLCP